MGSDSISVAEREQESISDEDKDGTSIKDHWKCLAACTLVSVCPFQYGIDFGLIAGLQAMDGFLEVFGYEIPSLDPSIPPTWNISTERQQLISSLMTLGAFLSSCVAGPIATYLSRRASIWAAIVLCCAANVTMMATTSIGGLYAGRLLIGLANGMLMTFSQLYIQECSPARYRGLMISAFQIWTSIGTLIGTIVDNFTSPLQGRKSYLIPLGIVYVMPVLLFFGLFLIPDSPRWLMQHGEVEQARKSLRWHRPHSDFKVDKEANEIQKALQMETDQNQRSGFLEIFRDPIDRRRTLLSIAVLSTQGGSGAMYMISYGTYFFKVAGIDKPFQSSCILTAVGVLAIIINSIVITRIGRRRVFLSIGLTICGISQLLTAVIWTVKPGSQDTGKGIVALAVVYIFGYNGMVAAYAWMSGGELPSQRLRSHTFGLASAAGFLLAWLASFTAPYFINGSSLNWGPKYGYIWFPSCIISATWVYLFLPEVKGRTLEEIDDMFQAKLPARKFRKYQCVGHVANSDTKREIAVAEEAPWSGGAITAEVSTVVA